MLNYILSVVGVALCVGILEEMLPSSYGSKAYVRLLTGLCLLAVMIAPVGNVLRAIPDALEQMAQWDEGEEEGGRYEEILKGSMSGAVRDTIKTAVREDLSEKFGVNAEKTDVGISFEEGEEICVKRMVITLRGVDILKNPHEIEDYFERLLSCECVVVSG
jgi:hypothetical protein